MTMQTITPADVQRWGIRRTLADGADSIEIAFREEGRESASPADILTMYSFSHEERLEILLREEVIPAHDLRLFACRRTAAALKRDGQLSQTERSCLEGLVSVAERGDHDSLGDARRKAADLRGKDGFSRLPGPQWCVGAVIRSNATDPGLAARGAASCERWAAHGSWAEIQGEQLRDLRKMLMTTDSPEAASSP